MSESRLGCRETDEQQQRYEAQLEKLRGLSAEGRRMEELALYKDRLAMCLFRVAHEPDEALE